MENLEDMEKELKELQEVTSVIKYQLDMAEIRKQEGIAILPQWKAKANTALRIKNRRIQELTVLIAKMKKDNNKKFQLTRERIFIDIIKERLNQSELKEIWLEVDKRLDSNLVSIGDNSFQYENNYSG